MPYSWAWGWLDGGQEVPSNKGRTFVSNKIANTYFSGENHKPESTHSSAAQSQSQSQSLQGKLSTKFGDLNLRT
jgi:hypothetical protein